MVMMKHRRSGKLEGLLWRGMAFRLVLLTGIMTLAASVFTAELKPASDKSVAGVKEEKLVSQARVQNGVDMQYAGEAVNVKDYGAVGDAKYHHHFADRSMKDPYQYLTGYYSYLVLTTKVETDSYTKRTIEYEIPDESMSVRATDDSIAFDTAIAESDGRLYLPDGDYMISQLTAANIKSVSGSGRIWLKEWNGGNTWYLADGTLEKTPLVYQNDGWIDAAHFNDEIWRAMHWITDLPQVFGWNDSSEFSGNMSPRSEFSFDKTRDSLNTWMTVQPAVSKEAFEPMEITICIRDINVKYTIKGDNIWNEAASGVKYDAAMFDLRWNGESKELSRTRWHDENGVVKVTLRKEDFFDDNASYAFHCWTPNVSGLNGEGVEYITGMACVWIDSARDRDGRLIETDGWLMCDIGSDMRSEDGNIREACDSSTRVLSSEPKQFYAYIERRYDLIDYLEDIDGEIEVKVCDSSGSIVRPADNVLKVASGTEYGLQIEISTTGDKGFLGDSTYFCDIPYITEVENVYREIVIDEAVIGTFSLEQISGGGRLTIVTNNNSDSISHLSFNLENVIRFSSAGSKKGENRFWPFEIYIL